MKTSLLLLAVLLLSLEKGISQQPASIIPDFSFERADGTAFSKKDLPRSSLAFFVFFDTQCDHCQHALQYLNTHRLDFIKANLYLITLDNQEDARSFLEKNAAQLVKAKNVWQLFDTKNQFIARFRPRKYPSLMLYSGTGKLLLYEDDEKKLPAFAGEIRKHAVK